MKLARAVNSFLIFSNMHVCPDYESQIEIPLLSRQVDIKYILQKLLILYYLIGGINQTKTTKLGVDEP